MIFVIRRAIEYESPLHLPLALVISSSPKMWLIPGGFCAHVLRQHSEPPAPIRPTIQFDFLRCRVFCMGGNQDALCTSPLRRHIDFLSRSFIIPIYQCLLSSVARSYLFSFPCRAETISSQFGPSSSHLLEAAPFQESELYAKYTSLVYYLWVFIILSDTE